MLAKNSDRACILVVIATFVLFVIGRIFGGMIFDNHWSFSHWQHIGLWYPFLWALFAIAMILFLEKMSGNLAKWLTSSRRVSISLLMLFIFFVVNYLDSFLFGAGNIRVSQISQAETIIYRWFEFGSISIVSAIYHLLSLLGLSTNSASVLGWRIFAFLSSAFAIAGTAKLAVIFGHDRQRQILLFLIGLFGAHAILLFGFIGIESAIVPVTIWSAYLAIRISRDFSIRNLLLLWLLTIFGLILHLSMAFLVPAAIFVTISALYSGRWSLHAAFVGGILCLAALLHIVYHQGSENFEFTKYVLYLNGKLPFSDYSLFSSRRIGDLLGLFFLLAPITLAAKSIAFIKRDWVKLNAEVLTIWFMAFGGTIVVLILDPINSIVLDTPRLAAYLTPYSLILMMMLRSRDDNKQSSNKLPALIAAVSISIVFAYFPTYRYLSVAESYTAAYVDEHKPLWRTTSIALRDAFYQRDNFDKANEWDLALPIKSTDYLALRSCNDLISNDGFSDALQVLHRLVATNPYWTEPRSMLAATQIRLGRTKIAKPHVDTCLLLEYYNVQHHQNLYNYHRVNGQYAEALLTIEKSLKIIPQNLSLLASLMVANFLIQDLDKSDSLSQYLISVDSTLPGPYYLKALIEDSRGNLDIAEEYYRKFVIMAPNDPDQPNAAKRLNEIVLQLKKTQ